MKKHEETFAKILVAALLLALIPILVFVPSSGNHKHKHHGVVLSINGHQSDSQKRQKGAQSRAVLKAVEQTRNPITKARICDQLPEGYGHMGVCAAAPAYLAKSQVHSSATGLLRGIDTSHWDYCSSSIIRTPQFWFVSVGDGNYYDPCQVLVTNMLVRAGIPHGTYYFTRQYLNPITSADRYAAFIRNLGDLSSNSLLPVNDAEAITSCSWIHSFDNRLKSDLHISRIIDYSSPGLWPGCNGNGNVDWTAEYGPRVSALVGFANWTIWQYTDGNVGPSPHCYGVCGDVDILNGTILPFIQKPVFVPILPWKYHVKCSSLDAITWWKQHHGRVSLSQHLQAVTLRSELKAHKVGCTNQPHSAPYKYPQRKGALA